MKHLRTLLIVGALAVNMLGIAALVSAQDATATPAPTTAAPEATTAPDTDNAQEAPAPYLGIGFEGTEGGITVINVVEGSPAAAAGIAVDDVITAINGTPVTEENLRETILASAIGDTLAVSLTRGEEQLTVDVTLAAAPEDFGRPGRPGRPDVEIFRADRPRLGVGIEDSDAGVVINEVAEGSPAEAAGILVDDVLAAVNGTPVATAEEAARAVAEAVDAAEVGEFTVAVTVTRGGELLDLTATLVKSEMPEIPDFIIPDLPGGGRGDGRGDGRGFGFGLPGFNIVPREGEEGAFDVVVPFTPADPSAVTQDVIDALAAIGITITPREGEEGVFDLTIPAESLGNGMMGGFSFPDLESMLPEGFEFNGPLGRNFRFEIPAIPGQPAQPDTAGGAL